MGSKGITAFLTLILALALGATAGPASTGAEEVCDSGAIDGATGTVVAYAPADPARAIVPRLDTGETVTSESFRIRNDGAVPRLLARIVKSPDCESAKKQFQPTCGKCTEAGSGCCAQCTRIGEGQCDCTCAGAECGLKRPGTGGKIEVLPSR